MMKIKTILFLSILSILTAQVGPAKALHRNPPRAWALTNATVHASPGKTIEDGTVVMRDGIITAVGAKVKIPKQATIIDMDGKHIYAGFIESWLDVKTVKKDTSLQANWNSNMRAYLKGADLFHPKEKSLKELHGLGFTTAHVTPKGGIFQGSSGLVQLGQIPKVLSNNVAQVVEYAAGGWGAKEYPTSLLGAIAFIRQGFLDADWYSKSQAILAKYPDGNEPIQADRSLEELSNAKRNRQPFVFRTGNELYIDRSSNIAEEFELNLWIMGNGYEYRRIEEMPASFMIVPLNFPAKPEVADPQNALQYSTEQLKHWDMAPDNAAKLADAGFQFALTSAELKDKKDFRKNLSRAVNRGLDESAALAALTTNPAKEFGQAKRLGKVAPGFIANLVVTDGNYFDKKSKVQSVWIDGNEYEVAPDPLVDAVGDWTLIEGSNSWTLSVKADGGSLNVDEKKLKLANYKLDQDRISFSVNADTILQKGVTRFKGTITGGKATGYVFYPDGSSSGWTAVLDSVKAEKGKKSKKESASNLSLVFPEGAYGLDGDVPNPRTILINDATIWTSGPKGVLKEWDILFQDGKVKKIARNISLPRGNALVINGKGKHVTPGLIDAHSHMAGESINEGFQNVTAEVRMRDVIDPNDVAMYRALAGGLTTINLLHGSANPIGGQNVVMKLRWGSFSNDLILKHAPQGIKFALGENVKRKRSYGRYPETRMGVEQVIRDAFTAARDYQKTWDTYKKDVKLQRSSMPPRRDLELDAMVEIMEGKRLVHSHSYRQDEILMLTRIAEDFGFRMATFQHVLEGYKVAERLAEHGAGASTFSDWWAYKYEVVDAIPYNGTLMTNAGVTVSFNSDSDELARRMNLEAAKAVKYGGLDEAEALKFVTINPAKQLKIDKHVGSLELGKDADFVVWSGHPLSTYSICEQTWLDGKQYFSLEQDQYYRERDSKVRNDLIQKILQAPDNGGKKMKPKGRRGNRFHSCDAFESYTFEGEE
ncbi:MAG TPA: amidohydrolase [Candidatus Marinimicrobia bacterium]|jgi:imidazolonepropionase-like amidohydrolase|nr:amidohydrolase [Candidatus Neomarinimicrobiota bacterium]HIB79494.1 amidohydrolase [Candidatus Neomarinimicrobiota bacterium]